jgi:predicted MFS family arabinose efflux permease
MVALFSVSFGSSTMMRVCDPMLPALARDFGVTTGQAAWTISAYAIAYGLMQFFYGPAGDRWGKRRVIGCAALATLVGNLLALVAPSLPVLVLARVLSGAAAAGIIALVLAWVGDTVPYADRQPVLARFLMASLFGMMAGQWIAGMLIQNVGWRSVFLLLVLLLGIGGAALLLHPAVRAAGRANGPAHGHLQAIGQVLAVPWARTMLAFVAVEAALAFSAIAFLPTYLVNAFSLPLAGAAAIVALYGLGGLVYATVARWLLRRLGETGLVLTAGAALALAWWTVAAGKHWGFVVPASMIGGLGFYSLHGVMQTHATQMAPTVRGTAVSLFAATMFIGIALGVSGAGFVVDRVGYAPLFLVCGTALVVLSVVFAARLRARAARTMA